MRLWEFADRLVAESNVTIDRWRGAAHPHYPDSVGPLDYGYLDGTTAGDGTGIDIWRGRLPEDHVTGMILTIDLRRRDAEGKFLVGCTGDEAAVALAAREAESQAAVLVQHSTDEADNTGV